MNDRRDPAPGSTAPIDGISLNYEADLFDSPHPTLAFIHGFGASLQTWNDLWPLSILKYPSVRLDLKGSGFSSAPNDESYSLQHQASLLLKFLTHLNLKDVVLVGQSLGGGIAILSYVSLLGAPNSIRALVLIDSAGFPQRLPSFVWLLRYRFTRFLAGLQPPKLRARFVLRQLFSDKRKAEDAQRIHNYAFFWKRPEAWKALCKTAKEIIPKDHSQLVTRFGSIKVPTLIIWGKEDGIIPVSHADKFQAAIPHSKLVKMDKTGHVPHEERPTEVFHHIDQFVTSLSRS